MDGSWKMGDGGPSLLFVLRSGDGRRRRESNGPTEESGGGGGENSGKGGGGGSSTRCRWRRIKGEGENNSLRRGRRRSVWRRMNG